MRCGGCHPRSCSESAHASALSGHAGRLLALGQIDTHSLQRAGPPVARSRQVVNSRLNGLPRLVDRNGYPQPLRHVGFVLF